MLEAMPLGATLSGQEYWQEEMARPRKYAAKMQKRLKSESLQVEAVRA